MLDKGHCSLECPSDSPQSHMCALCMATTSVNIQQSHKLKTSEYLYRTCPTALGGFNNKYMHKQKVFGMNSYYIQNYVQFMNYLLH